MSEELEQYLRDADVSDPNSITKVLAYLDDLEMEDEEFMETLKQRVSQETIYWEQPWYQKGSLTRKVVKKVDTENHSELFRTDYITSGEADIIQRNWQKFRKKYQMPDKLICFVRWKSKHQRRNPNNSPTEMARRFLTAYLARNTERPLDQVYRYLYKLCKNSTNRPYSKYEEKVIKICVYNDHRTATSNASKILNREPRGIYKKTDEILYGKLEKKRMKWTLPLAEKLVNSLISYSGSASLDDLRSKKIEKSVWLQLANDFDQFYLSIQKFWISKLYVQLFVRREVFLNKFRKKMYKRLKKSTIRVWSDIRWKDLLKECPDGFTHQFLYGILHKPVAKIENYLRKPLPEVVSAALSTLKQNKMYKRDFRLRTLSLENGELKDIKYS